MLDWVLDRYYFHDLPRQVEKSVRVFDTHESGLVSLMEQLSASHSRAKLFSLPHTGAVNSIELGFRGEQAAVEAAFTNLLAALKAHAVIFENLDAGLPGSAVRQSAA